MEVKGVKVSLGGRKLAFIRINLKKFPKIKMFFKKSKKLH